jgi:DNA-directed RNA polymerase subunit RPC12/RpoP
MARAVQDGRLTSQETQRITDAGLAFGMSLIFGTVLGVLVRSVIAGVLEPEEKAVQPVIDFMLPDAGSLSLLPLVIKCAWCGKYLGEKEPYEDKSVTHGICPECRAKYFPKKKDDQSSQTYHSVHRDDLKKIAGKYGWWAAR